MLLGGPTLGPGGMGPDGTRRCWSCDEIVVVHAVACRHCGASLIRQRQGAGFGATGLGAADLPHTPYDRAPYSETSYDLGLGTREPYGSGGLDELSELLSASRRQGAAAADASARWSDSDFERISRTAGSPYDAPARKPAPKAPRTERPAPPQAKKPADHGGEPRGPDLKRTGGGTSDPIGPGPGGSGGEPRRAGLGKERAFTPSLPISGMRTKWVVAGLLLVAVGGTSGWLVGKLADNSTVSHHYELVTDLVGSLTRIPLLRDTPTAEASTDLGPVVQQPQSDPITPAPSPVVAAAPADASATPAAEPPLERELALSPPLVDPKAVASPPTPSAGTDNPSGDTPASTTEVPAWTVQDVQRELRRLGYYKGLVDGLVGPRTREAVRAFQEQAGLAVSGRIEPAVVRELERMTTVQATGSGTPGSARSQ